MVHEQNDWGRTSWSRSIVNISLQVLGKQCIASIMAQHVCLVHEAEKFAQFKWSFTLSRSVTHNASEWTYMYSILDWAKVSFFLNFCSSHDTQALAHANTNILVAVTVLENSNSNRRNSKPDMPLLRKWSFLNRFAWFECYHTIRYHWKVTLRREDNV